MNGIIARKLTKWERDHHPSIHHTGSIAGMKKLGYWGKNDVIVRCGGCYYNMSITIRDYPGRYIE